MAEPYYADESVTLYHGDADGSLGGEPILPQLTDTFDAILTDPPYNVSADRSGREGTTLGRLKRKDGTSRKVNRVFGDWDRAWDPSAFLAEVPRLLRKGGSLIAFTSEFLMGAYTASGLNHRNLIYWRKTNPTPAFKQLYVRAIEMAVWQVNGKGGWTWNAGGYQPNVYEGPTVAGFACANGETRVHPTQKPLWLMRALVDVHTNPGAVILDPYAGSGTTLVAARFLGRRAVGIEGDEAYCEAIATRLAQGVLELDAP